MTQSQAPPDEVRATVTNITGEKGKEFAVAFPTHDDGIPLEQSITFSIRVWEGKHSLEPGQKVVLSDLEEFARGWRARRARPVLFTQKQNKE